MWLQVFVRIIVFWILWDSYVFSLDFIASLYVCHFLCNVNGDQSFVESHFRKKWEYFNQKYKKISKTIWTSMFPEMMGLSTIVVLRYYALHNVNVLYVGNFIGLLLYQNH